MKKRNALPVKALRFFYLKKALFPPKHMKKNDI
jgi:hypothetical protein